jgi:hypothetical protein
MTRYTAIIRVDVSAESTEARDYLVETLVDRLNKKPPGVRFEDVGTAQLTRAKVSRIRKARRR